MHNKILVAGLVAAAILMAACAPVPPGSTQAPAASSSTSADNLAGTSWALATLDGQPVLKEPTAMFTARSSDGRVHRGK